MFAAALPLEVFADDWQSKVVLDISGNDYDYMGEHASPSLYSSGASCSMDYVYAEGARKPRPKICRKPRFISMSRRFARNMGRPIWPTLGS